MKEFIDKMANNDYVLIALIALLIILVITFFIVLLFSGKKRNNVKDTKNSDSLNNDVPVIEPNANVDFNHEEYVKETTAEFELSPIADIKPINEEVIPIIQEESPSRKVENVRPVDDAMMNTFSFDELSRMISEELNKSEEDKDTNNVNIADENKALVFDNTSNENSFPFSSFKPLSSDELNVSETPIKSNFDEVSSSNIEPETNFIDAFKPVSDVPEAIETKKTNDISDSLRAKFNNNFGSLFMNEMIKTDDEIELPKMAETTEKVEDNIEKEEPSVEPVIKEEEVPLFARFNQETYDINKKD